MIPFKIPSNIHPPPFLPSSPIPHPKRKIPPQPGTRQNSQRVRVRLPTKTSIIHMSSAQGKLIRKMGISNSPPPRLSAPSKTRFEIKTHLPRGGKRGCIYKFRFSSKKKGVACFEMKRRVGGREDALCAVIRRNSEKIPAESVHGKKTMAVVSSEGKKT